MYTQNTPVHVKLWHRDFWRLAIANLLLTMSVYMLIPVVPRLIMRTFTPMQTAVCMGIYGLGIFALGGFCSYWVQRYRRNHVCIYAILAMMASIGALYYFIDGMGQHPGVWWPIAVVRFILGASFGVAQMVLMSTLIIDTSESFQRTEANHSAAWFGRFALSIGPLTALIIYNYFGFQVFILSVEVCCLLSVVLIVLVDFPFKAPEDRVCVYTLDRFFLPHGTCLFVNLVLVTTVLGLLMSLPLEPLFYAMMMAGFFLALLAQKFVFVNAELKSEIVTGLLLIAVALLIMTVLQSSDDVRYIPATHYVAPVLVGLGTGIVGSRFLLFFIKLSKHCQRGTSQSTYFLAWEGGLSLGLFIGYGYLTVGEVYVTACVMTVISWLMYHIFTHSWYLRNKNR